MRFPIERPVRWTMAALAVAALVAACGLVTGANPDYCDLDNPCIGDDRLYCDTTGEYNDDGRRNRCVPWPFDGNTLCETSADCDEDPTEPICELGSAGVCRPCNTGDAGDAECAAKDPARPLCEGGRCVAGCQMSSECPTDTPICSGSVCAPCSEGETGDADCAARDTAFPRCGPDGDCVVCLGSGDCEMASAPICDPGSLMCRGCEDHEECPDGVCDIPEGTCVAAGAIVFVDPDTGTDGAACGARGSPCETVTASSGALDKIDSAKRVIYLLGGQYDESIEVTSGETVLMVGEIDGEGKPLARVVPPPSSDRPGLLVTSGSKVRIDRLVLENASGGNNADGIRCSTGEVAVFRSVVGPNQATGIQAADCVVSVERSTVKRNLGGGLALTDSDFTIVNNFIVENGDAISSNFGGVRISNVGGITTQDLQFNTVARNVAAIGSTGVDCSTVDSTSAHSNIVWGVADTPPSVIGNCDFTYSDIRGPLVAGMGNINSDPQFADFNGGDYHIEMGSPARHAADPNATLAVDIDGEARPQPSGGRSDMGADEYVPPPGS